MFFKKKKVKEDFLPFGNETNLSENKKENSESLNIDNYLFDSSIKKLNSLIGLESVKTDILSIVQLQKINSIKQSRGIKIPIISNHLIFSGNPGTGKTTVARIIADIYKALNIVEHGQLIEVDRSGLIGKYQGETELKTKEVIESAKGGILFIDEAYTLSQSENDYGQRAIEVLLKEMEDNRNDFIVIAAGYTDQMNLFLQSNPGLASRFGRVIKFEDYSTYELYEIMIKYSKEYGYELESTSKNILMDYFSEAVKKPHFANGRFVRLLIETCIKTQAIRLSDENKINVSINDADLRTITINDIKAAIKLL